MSTIPNLGNIVFGPGFKDFDKYFVGFDDQILKMSKMNEEITKHIPNYPPYNIKKVSDNKYVIEIAVAGFSKQELEVTMDDSVLTVSGNLSVNDQITDSVTQYLHKGISERAFTRKFTLADSVEIKNAEYINGMLKIWLDRLIPTSKSTKIDIKDKSNA
jgi:molecular chaperone IbpA